MKCFLEILFSAACLFIAAYVCPAQENITYSPDSSFTAYTLDGNLWVRSVRQDSAKRVTFDGGRDGILNGKASWVYYEEIFGRSSNYRAFWWSPDSKRLAFFRFDESKVSVFPIYSPYGSSCGTLRETRYPLAGQTNPSVKAGLYNLEDGRVEWIDMGDDDHYLGTPFFSPDGRCLYLQKMPRRQSVLDLWEISCSNGNKRKIYHEECATWLDWIDSPLVTDRGIYMARDFQSGWQQIYFLDFNLSAPVQLTSGRNWDIRLLKAGGRKNSVWFSAKRDSRLHNCVYRMDKGKDPLLLSDTLYNASKVSVKGDSILMTLSTAATSPRQAAVHLYAKKPIRAVPDVFVSSDSLSSAQARPQPVKIFNDGFELYGLITYPKGFDPSEKYPVVMQVYGGPGTPYVRDDAAFRFAYDKWCHSNGVIFITVDPRSSGENGKRGMDQAFRQMTVVELEDYVAWARWLQDRPFVKADRIGVEGFSFGGTSTAMLVLKYPQYFRCGIAGGGVYDWTLYDTHYTERFMETPDANPDGYSRSSVLQQVERIFSSGSTCRKALPGALKITHGTADDNVHLQNSLLLADVLQKAGYQFEMMFYPDALHGYRGTQGRHSDDADAAFWTRWLLD